MTRIVNRKIRTANKTASGGQGYKLYTYQLDDGSEVDSLQVFNAGEHVEVWFDHKWNKAKIKKHVPKETL